VSRTFSIEQILFFIGFAAILTGCVTSSVNILESKEIAKPFSKLLLIYIDEDCNLKSLDSTTYNICIKKNFINSDNLELRTESETAFYNKLSSSRTVFVKSSDLFNAGVNDYGSFISEIENLRIDGILIISRTGSQHRMTNRGYYGAYNPAEVTSLYPPGFALDDGYTCYFMKSDTFLPVWIGQFYDVPHLQDRYLG
jgi:hypothetical protein